MNIHFLLVYVKRLDSSYNMIPRLSLELRKERRIKPVVSPGGYVLLALDNRFNDLRRSIITNLLKRSNFPRVPMCNMRSFGSEFGIVV